MRNTTRKTHENRTITVDFRDDATYFQLLAIDLLYVSAQLT